MIVRTASRGHFFFCCLVPGLCLAFSSIGVCSMMQSPPMTLEPAPEGRDPNPGPGPGDDYSGSDYRSGRITNLAVGVCAREPMPHPSLQPPAPSIKSHAEPNQGPSCPRSGTMTVPCNKGGALLRKAPTRASLANGRPPSPRPWVRALFGALARPRRSMLVVSLLRPAVTSPGMNANVRGTNSWDQRDPP